MHSLIAIALAAAATAAGPPPTRPEATVSAASGCGDPSAIVQGPPAPELFDPYRPSAGSAVWCERYDKEGRTIREGPYADQYPSGALRTRAHFIADALEGAVEVRHESGGIWLETRYHDGRLDGPYVMYRPDGRVWLRGFYVDGRPHGVHAVHHPDGTLATETHYENGVESGLSRAWWPNGVPRRERTVVNGVWNGPSASWFETGRVESEGRWAPCAPDADATSCASTGAARHGRWQTWHATGHRASRGQYRFGEKVGTWVYWDEAGEPETVNAHGQEKRLGRNKDLLPAGPAAVSRSEPGTANTGTSRALNRATPPRKW